jgi:hypothetical protein
MKRLMYVMLIAVLGGVLFSSTPEQSMVAQQAQPIPSANDDVRIVAGLLLAQELLNIASTTAVTPEGMLKLATRPIQEQDPKWDGSGLTSQARAAAGSSSLARSELLLAPANKEFQVTPTKKIKNPLLQRAGTAQNNALKDVYEAMKEAEQAGQMELAYALASAYLTNGLFNNSFFGRGVANAIELIESCLAGNNIKLQISDPSSGRITEFDAECSKYKALQAVVATEIAPGAYSFLGPLVDVGCDKIFEVATNGKAVGLRLAAARAYVQGVQLFAGVFDPCIKPGEGQSEVDALLDAARKAKASNHQELLEEIVGYDYQVYDGVIELYSSLANRRGLAKALEGASVETLEQLAQDSQNPEIGLAAYYELGTVHWVNKPEEELRTLMANDQATPAVRRAATLGLLLQLGRAFDVQCLQNLANGQECQ